MKKILIGLLPFLLIILGLFIFPKEQVKAVYEYEIYYNEEPEEQTEIQTLTYAALADTEVEQEESTFKPLEIPLDEELQKEIFDYCSKHNISPFLVLSMAYQESRFESDAIGDNGKSFGMFQIQPRWHEERISRLEVTNLLNPMQNTKVAIDFLCELYTKNDDVFWVLHAYNGGEAYANNMYKLGKESDYASEIVDRATEYEVEYVEN